MKKQMLLAGLLAVSVAVNAQSEKKETLNKFSQVNYTVAADGKKDGLYFIKNTINNGTWAQGRYKADERTGTWYFFDGKNKLVTRYNYDNRTLVYLDTAQLRGIDVRVISNDAEVVKNASVPVPLCAVDYYINLVTNQVYENYSKHNEGFKAEITARVDAQGHVAYTVSYNVNGQKTAPAKFTLDGPFTVDWVPSKYNGKTYAAEFTVYTEVDAKSDAYRRFRWDRETN